VKADMGEKLFFGLSSLAVIVAVVAAFFLMGSPAEQRLKKFDARRVSDLQRTRQAVENYHRNKKELPKDMDTVAESWPQIAKKDPQTEKPYVYRIVDQHTYKLCAEFSSASEGRVDIWSHPKGEHCFTFHTPHVKR